MNKNVAPKIKRADEEERVVSAILAQALHHVKDFMTDSQKASILAKEGKTMMDNGDLKDAIDCFNEGISYNPTVALFNLRATTHKLLEMYTEAYFDYSYSIRLEPENGSHYCNRGLCLSKLKKIAMALEDFEVAIQFEPSATHYYSRASTYADFGKFQLAIAGESLFLHYLDLYWTVFLNCRFIEQCPHLFCNCSDYTLAIGDEGHGNATSELKLRCKYRRALAYFEIEQYDDVVKDVNAILHQDPNSVQARALLGRALKILNDFKKAEEQLSIAILLDSAQANLYIGTFFMYWYPLFGCLFTEQTCLITFIDS